MGPKMAVEIDGHDQGSKIRISQAGPAVFDSVKHAQMNFAFGNLTAEIGDIATGYNFPIYPSLAFHDGPEWLHHSHESRLGHVLEKGAHHADPNRVPFTDSLGSRRLKGSDNRQYENKHDCRYELACRPEHL